MKIGIMGTRGIPNNYGGFEQFATFLSLGLVQKGHEVYVYTPSHHPFTGHSWNNVDLIRIYDPEKTWRTASQFIYDRNCLIDASRRGFDVLLHLGYTSDAVFHRKWRGPMRHMVNMDGLEWKRTKYNRLTRWFLLKAESMAARHADELVADSEAVQQYLLEKYHRKASFIPYGATIFENAEEDLLAPYALEKEHYGLLIARMEPENNIEPVIKAWVEAGKKENLVIVGGLNAYGRKLCQRYENKKQIRFIGAIYDQVLLNNLRYFSKIYFHGHSVGGTNPSLLEAMACGCNIIAQDNVFNRSVLLDGGLYFKDEKDLSLLLDKADVRKEEKRNNNLNRIREHYNWERVIQAYEQLMFAAISEKTKVYSIPGQRQEIQE